MTLVIALVWENSRTTVTSLTSKAVGSAPVSTTWSSIHPLMEGVVNAGPLTLLLLPCLPVSYPIPYTLPYTLPYPTLDRSFIT